MKRVVLFAICTLLISRLNAQDTLRVTLEQVQSKFIDQNLDLIAQRYNMDAGEAMVKQARLFSNPSFSMSRELYSGEKKKFFDTGSNAEYSLQVQQLFSIAGKRHNEIAMAKLGYDVSRFSYMDLMRSLKYQLSSSFYQLYFNQQSLSLFSSEEKSISSIIAVYKEQKKRGNVSEKDLLRMIALQESLQHQRLDVENQIENLQHDLNILLRTSNKVYLPFLVEGWEKRMVGQPLPSLGALIDSVAAIRPDVKIMQTNLKMAEQNVRLQKSLAVPDIAIGSSYDRIGGPSKQFVGISASFDLPFFNRNQGNISSAKATMKALQIQGEALSNKAVEDVVKCYNVLMHYQQAVNMADSEFILSYKRIVDAAQMQYIQKNMSLLEFLDLYDSYKVNYLQWNDRWMRYLIAKEELNYQVGATVVN